MSLKIEAILKSTTLYKLGMKPEAAGMVPGKLPGTLYGTDKPMILSFFVLVSPDTSESILNPAMQVGIPDEISLVVEEIFILHWPLSYFLLHLPVWDRNQLKDTFQK